MQHADSGETWERTIDDLEVVRWTAGTGGSTLVRLRLTNTGSTPLAVRIIDELPDAATDAVLITTTDDVADSWHHVGDWVVHEFGVPPGGKRTNAYLIKSDEEPPLSLTPPDIETVESVSGGQTDVREAIASLEDSRHRPDARSASGGSETGSTVDRFPRRPENRPDVSAESDGTRLQPDREDADTAEDRREPAQEESRDGASSPTDESEPEPQDAEGAPDETSETIVDDLLEALEDATPEQRRALRSKLGASESERARLDHVQARLADLAAYVDVLEELIDDHGVDVVGEMRASIEENGSGIATLETEVAALEDEFERHRTDTTSSLEAIEKEMTAIWSGLSDRLETLESELNSTRSELTDLAEDVEADRQTRAREVRRFDRSVSDIERTLERLAEDVEEHEAFRRRFTAAFSSGSDTLQDDYQSSEPDEDDSLTRPN